MTEQDWLSDKAYLGAIIGGVYYRLGERKVRLFAAACCRRVWHLIKDERSRRAVEFVEQMADRGRAGRRGRPASEKEAFAACNEARHRRQALLRGTDSIPYLAASAEHCALCAAMFAIFSNACYSADQAASHAALAIAYTACNPTPRPDPVPPGRQHHLKTEERLQRRLLREIFGNPFRPVPVAPAWRTPAVLSVAGGIYQERAFGQMPVLADALEEAGCDDEVILAHCRGEGEHVLGCWLIDLLLGKA